MMRLFAAVLRKYPVSFLISVLCIAMAFAAVLFALSAENKKSVSDAEAVRLFPITVALTPGLPDWSARKNADILRQAEYIESTTFTKPEQSLNMLSSQFSLPLDSMLTPDDIPATLQFTLKTQYFTHENIIDIERRLRLMDGVDDIAYPSVSLTPLLKEMKARARLTAGFQAAFASCSLFLLMAAALLWRRPCLEAARLFCSSGVAPASIASAYFSANVSASLAAGALVVATSYALSFLGDLEAAIVLQYFGVALAFEWIFAWMLLYLAAKKTDVLS